MAKQNIDIMEAGFKPWHTQVMVGSDELYRTDLIRRTEDWPRWMLLWTRRGGGRIVDAQGEYLAGPREAILLPANYEYAFTGHPDHLPWVYRSAQFLPRPHWYRWLHWPRIGASRVMRIKVAGGTVARRITDGLARAYRHATTPHERWEDFAMSAVEEVLLWLDEINPMHAIGDVDPRIRQALEYMQARLDEKLTRADIAAEAGVSGSHIGDLFRSEVGAAPMEYFERLRINEAMRLLRQTTETADQIGRVVGFDSPTYFSKRFRKYAGVSPGVYRNQLR